MADHEVSVTEPLSPGSALNGAQTGENAGNYEVEVKHDSAKRTSSQQLKRNRKIAFAVAVVIAVLGIIFFIIGVVLIAKSKSEGKKSEKSLESEKVSTDDVPEECAFSKEAKRAGLPDFFKKVDRSFYELFPYYSGKTTDDIHILRKLFQPYNPTPESIKAIAERSQSLWAELNMMKIDRTLLLAREQRMIAITEHFLKHYFGRPYENNYLSGYWMLGPGRYCTRTFKGITSIKYQLAVMLSIYRPKTSAELEDSLTLLEKFKDGINQFKENLKNGIRTGMVGSVTLCKEGKECLEDIYPEIASQRSGRGVLSWFTDDRLSLFISSLPPEESDKITKRHGKNGSALVEESLIRNVGSPIADLLEYLENEHLPHCVPSNVSSGLGTLPVDYVYFNGSRTAQRTNRTLANGDRIISGKESYSNFMSLHTTQSITPDEVNSMGWKMLNELYSQAVKIAKQITRKENDDEAVRELRKHLNSSAMYFNENPFPENESNKEAFRKCKNVKDAQVYCPERYKTMLKWQDLALNTIARIRPKLTSLFYFVGNKTTAPNCPVSMGIRFNPLVSVQSYSGGSSTCAVPGRYRMPFFVDRMGPRFFEFTVNAHEASPGHHTQSQGYIEHFRDVCRAIVDYDFLKNFYVTAFREGWALYAENPLAAQDTDLYQDRPLETYGAIKSQIWRALRLIIDTGLHYKNLTRDQALDLFNRYMWDDSDVVANEVSRYQAWPGQATSYMTGQLAIWGMRNETRVKLGNLFKIQDFHYHILSHGGAPISFLRSNIKRYVNCVLFGENEGCKDVLTANKKQESYSEATFKEDNKVNLRERNEMFRENDDEEAIYEF